jgi:hypothetical protein
VKYGSTEESNAAQDTLAKTKFRTYIGKDDEITRDMTSIQQLQITRKYVINK